MLNFAKRQINSIMFGGAKVFIRKTKNLPVFLKVIFLERFDPLWLWSLVRQSADFIGLKWSFPYFREATLIYSRSFFRSIKNYDIRAIELAADHMASLIHKGLTYQPDNFKIYSLLQSINLYSGHFNEWEKYEKLLFFKREQLLNQLLPLQIGIRIFSIQSVRGIGFMCHWDGLIKARHLGLIPPDKFVMLWNKEKFSANKHWMTYLEKYVVLLDENIQNRKLTGFLKSVEKKASSHVSGPIRIGNSIFVNNLSGLALIEHHWEKEDRAPLFKLNTEDIEFGRMKLSGLGVPKEAWFVCIHAREGGFKASEPFREAPVLDYLMAINEIVERGGWVIRMGDSTMSSLPKINHVIDYPHSEIFSDRMDIILCGLCRFFIGTSSGLYTVAKAFGKPIVQTNYLPPSTLYLSGQDIFLPKLAKRIKDSNLLGFSEIMSAPISQCVIDINYKQLGIELINNTPEEIMEIVAEMIDKLDGNFNPDSTDELLQAVFKEMTAEVNTLYGLDNFPINCRIGSRFLRKYQELLSPFHQDKKQAIKKNG